MNIDRDLINRALEKAGQNALVDDDITKNTVNYRLIKDFYLPTILETLTKTEWTSRKKRAVLTAYDTDLLPDNKEYAYSLPADCAKPVAIDNNKDFVIEGNILFCNVESPVLLYISNGKIAAAENYLTDDTYPAYAALTFDPLLSQYLETRLASKIVYKIAGKSELYQLLYAEAVQKEEEAEAASRAAARSRKNGSPWWGDLLGLNSSYEDMPDVAD